MKKNSDKKQTAPLTAKQRRFVDEYLIDFNATQSAIRAGYSEKTADVIGAENLVKPNIQLEIQKRQNEIKNTLEITQERVLNEIASIAFANATDFVRIGEEGVYIIPTELIAKEKLSALAGIKQGANGIEIKIHDKLKALDLLGKRLGLWDNQDDSEKLDKIADTLVQIKEVALNDRDKQ